MARTLPKDEQRLRALQSTSCDRRSYNERRTCNADHHDGELSGGAPPHKSEPNTPYTSDDMLGCDRRVPSTPRTPPHASPAFPCAVKTRFGPLLGTRLTPLGIWSAQQALFSVMWVRTRRAWASTNTRCCASLLR
ncbi:hypothetical protein A0H81_02553 [Grifola frondosa]|uniref:Uncharacterized protein n=1 Tax=Grifola frondosa TaxID=5627 RepID=A0A1C7MLR9_GRIFR|nr:hypothetical protein A0H81_02553 [Grifola frondosa]